MTRGIRFLLAIACLTQADLDRAVREASALSECRTICKILRRKDDGQRIRGECFCLEREPRSRIEARAYPAAPTLDPTSRGVGQDPGAPAVRSEPKWSSEWLGE